MSSTNATKTWNCRHPPTHQRIPWTPSKSNQCLRNIHQHCDCLQGFRRKCKGNTCDSRLMNFFAIWYLISVFEDSRSNHFPSFAQTCPRNYTKIHHVPKNHQKSPQKFVKINTKQHKPAPNRLILPQWLDFFHFALGLVALLPQLLPTLASLLKHWGVGVALPPEPPAQRMRRAAGHATIHQLIHNGLPWLWIPPLFLKGWLIETAKGEENVKKHSVLGRSLLSESFLSGLEMLPNMNLWWNQQTSQEIGQIGLSLKIWNNPI